MVDEQLETDVLEDTDTEYRLVVWNDNVNTFEWVIVCLVDIVKMDWIPAEQCSLIIHNNGKCEVKRGGWDKLKVYKDALIDRGLNVTIE